MFKKPPSDANQGILALWKKHGPLRVNKLIADGKITYEEEYSMKTKMNLGTAWYYSGQVISSGYHHNSYTMKEERGEMHGIGRDWNDGGMYEGEFKNNMQHGYGR